jgi:hypothetical protein
VTDPREANLNKLLISAIDEAIADLVGPKVVEVLHEHLLKFYGITADEIPYKLPMVDYALDKAFAPSSRIIEKYVAKKLYQHLGLRFVELPDCVLFAYVENAKKMLQVS